VERIEARSLAARDFDFTSPDAQGERSAIVTFRWRIGHGDAADTVARLASETQTVIPKRHDVMRVSPLFQHTR